MIPVLYTAGKSAKEITPMGALTDTISCDTKEERNGVYETTLVYPSSGELAEEIQPERIVYVKTNDTDDPQPMRIVTVTKEQDNTMTVYAQHVSYQLNGVVVMPFTASGIQDAISKLASYAPEFTFSSSNDSDAQFTVSTPTSLRSLLGGMEGSLLDVYGGEYHFDGWNITFDRARGTDRGALIAYGKNLTDLSAENDLSGAVTGVLPYYQDQEGNLTTLDTPITLEHSLSYERITPLDCSSEIEVEEGASQGVIQEALREYGEAWLKNQSAAAADSVTLSFESLYQAGEDATKALEVIALCDPVTIWDKRYHLKLTAKCITAEYDGLGEKYTSLEIGQTKSSFSSTLQSQVQGVSDTVNSIEKEYPSRWEQAIAEVAGKITGQANSHIMLYPMENPQMLIAAEDTDLSKPGVGALVINAAGIVTTTDIAAALAAWDRGENPFTGAMSIDGYLVERVMKAIQIEGQQIIAGVIQNTAGTVRIDLDSGDAYVPRLIGPAGNGVYYGIEQGAFNLSGANYSGIRFFRLVNVAPPFQSKEGDYFQVLRGSSNPYGYVRLRAINSDGNDVVIDLIGDNGTVSGSGDILQVRADSALSIKLKLTQDGWLSVPGGISFGPSAGVGGSAGLTGGRLESGGNFVSNNGGFYAQNNGQNVAYLTSGGDVHGMNVSASNDVSAANGTFANQTFSNMFKLRQDGLSMFSKFDGNGDTVISCNYTNKLVIGWAEPTSGGGTTIYRIAEFGHDYTTSFHGNINLNGYSILNQSDRRLKKYITGSKEKALTIIDAIPMRQYTYKVGAPGALPNKKVRFGQIAQELYNVYPEAVVHDEDKDEWYIDKMALIDPLIKAVQELSAKVTALEEKLNGKENANAG